MVVANKRLKRAVASWMGSHVVVFVAPKKGQRHTLNDKVLKTFKAGSKNMCENMARWAAKNGYDIINLRRSPKTGRLVVMV